MCSPPEAVVVLGTWKQHRLELEPLCVLTLTRLVTAPYNTETCPPLPQDRHISVAMLAGRSLFYDVVKIKVI